MRNMMNFDEKLKDVQQALHAQGIDGWLLYDFRRTNPLACQFLEIPPERLLTRRFFYWVPAKGTPVKIVHAIEDKSLEHLPGDTHRYQTWRDIESLIGVALTGSKQVAMEYSPRNAIPYVSKVDAGTIDVIRGFGVDVVSSADLLQKFTSVWDAPKLLSHRKAADVLCQAVDDAWKYIESCLRDNTALTEYDVQQFIVEQFAKNGCISADLPICAVNAHSADPHYVPGKNASSVVRRGDFILIDLWCKQDIPRAVYADITRVGVAAAEPTKRQQQIFSVVKAARDAATDLVRERFRQKQPLRGWEVDQAARDVIVEAGYGEFFIHRTGHNIDETDHGNGANIDNFETRDERLLLPGTCFSIEPGIYLPGEFGVRLEYDVVVHLDGSVEVTGGIQDEIVTMQRV